MNRSFGFVTFLEREDAAAAMDNMDGSELYGRVLTVNYAFPEKIKGGEQGWAAQPSMLALYLLFIYTSLFERCKCIMMVGNGILKWLVLIYIGCKN
jgi:RNA recognition motif-containing protein